MSYARFAIYYVPPDGALADFGAKWLGRDVATGQSVSQYDVSGLHEITMTPRRYGFHGTLKPPFRLRDARTLDDLEAAACDLAGTLSPAVCDGLKPTRLGRFLALAPVGQTDGLRRIADTCVRELDRFRAPAGEAELARRRKARLSARQDALLAEWGYPYVFEEFRFHLTLSDRLSEAQMRHWEDVLRARLPDLPAPFVVGQIALCGERPDGCFEVIHRYTLSG